MNNVQLQKYFFSCIILQFVLQFSLPKKQINCNRNIKLQERPADQVPVTTPIAPTRIVPPTAAHDLGPGPCPDPGVVPDLPPRFVHRYHVAVVDSRERRNGWLNIHTRHLRRLHSSIREIKRRC